MFSKKQSYTLFFVLLLFLTHCNSSEKNDKNSEVSKLKDEVLAIHDIAMERMDEIITKKMEQKKMLTKKIEVQNFDTLAIHKKINQLEIANRNMFNWMSNYHHDSVFLEEKMEINYFNNQKKLIQKVANDIDNALK